ncbi:MAG TPA: PspC domain-containing protein [Fibrobacteria bacterium]|nr:PspC domain-containing protein [Fibrobacteria bacterium]
MPLPKFRRSRSDRKIAGLFGGLGEAFGIDPTYLRLAFVLLALVTGVVPAVAAYAIGWLITVEDGDGSPDGRYADPQNEASGV